MVDTKIFRGWRYQQIENVWWASREDQFIPAPDELKLLRKISKSELETYLRSRSFFEIDRVMLDFDSYRVTFPLYNLTGQLIGYHHHNPDAESHNPKNYEHPYLARYFTRVSKGQLGVWGIHTLQNKVFPYIVLTEGVFDQCVWRNHQFASIAVLGNDPVHLRGWFKMLSRPLVAICDGDEAGRHLANSADHVIYLPEGKDSGSLKDREKIDIFHRILRREFDD